MVEIFLKTLPFFALIALGWGAGKRGFFSEEATAYLTRFVFYFALSAMLLRWTAQLSLSEVFSWAFVAAYLSASIVIYALVIAVAMWRGLGVAEAAVEAQCGVVGNVGFLGVPMLALLLGQAAVGPVVLVLGLRSYRVWFADRDPYHWLARRGRSFGLGAGRADPQPDDRLDLPRFGVVRHWLGDPRPLSTSSSAFSERQRRPAHCSQLEPRWPSNPPSGLSVAGWISFAKLVLHPVAVGRGGSADLPGRPICRRCDDFRRRPSGGWQRLYSGAALRCCASTGICFDPVVDHCLGRHGVFGDRLGCSLKEGMGMETISENVCFGGVQGVYSHASSAIGTDMTFGLFLPAEAQDGTVPGALVSVWPDLQPRECHDQSRGAGPGRHSTALRWYFQIRLRVERVWRTMRRMIWGRAQDFM